MNRLILAVLVLITSCQIPVSSPSTVHKTSQGTFSLKVSNPGLRVTADGGRTILPQMPTTFYYRVDLVGNSSFTFDNLTDFHTPFQAPVGTYALTVTLVDNTATPTTIGVSAAQNITITAVPADNQFVVNVLPSKGGNGTLYAIYDWPTTVANQASFVLVDIEDPQLPEIDLTGSFNISTGYATVNLALPSGTYLLTLNLSLQAGGTVFSQPPVSEVVQIYDNLTSYKYNSLSGTELNGPPAAPTDFSVAYDSGTNTGALNWIMPKGTHQGFHLYHNNVLVASVPRESVSSVLAMHPELTTDVYEIAAYNAFGDSPRVPSNTLDFSALPILAPVAYGLQVGTSETTSASNTVLHLVWNNPSAQTVTLYRAPNIHGPYSSVGTFTGESFDDTNVNGLIPGTTYYYAIASGGQYLLDLPMTTYYPTSRQPVKLQNRVANVVSGTTMAWDAALGDQAPVVGMPYGLPDSSQITPPSGSGNYWRETDTPELAILSGGYTYWVWGRDAFNGTETVVAAFDSDGNYVQSSGLYTRRYLTDVKYNAGNIEITGQELVPNGPLVTFIPWSELDWFGGPRMKVSIDFDIPLAPVVSFDSGSPTIDITVDYYRTIIPSFDPSLTSIEWTIDGSDVSSAFVNVSIDGTLDVDASALTLGTHELTLYVTDGVHVYSANFYILVMQSSEGGA